MRTVKVFQDANAHYVLAHPSLSIRYRDIYEIVDVPDDITDAEVLRRQNNTINATWLGNDLESRKTLRFSELSEYGMRVLMDPIHAC